MLLLEFLFKLRHDQFIQEVRSNNVCLSLSSNPGGSLLDVLNGLLGLLCLLVSSRGLLGGLLLSVLGGPHGLLPLGLPDLGLLVPLGHDVLKGGADNGPLKLLSPLVPLLGHILLLSLLVLPPVEHGPAYLTGVALQKVSLVGAAGQELVGLAVDLDQRSAVAGVDLVAGVDAEVDLHGDILPSLL